MSLLRLEGLRVTYAAGRRRLHAVDGVDLEIETGTTVGIVGESGSGKSSLAKAIVGLAPVSHGRIYFNERDVSSDRSRRDKRFRRGVQLIMQDPYSSLNPRMTVGELLDEPLSMHRSLTRDARRAEMRRLLELVNLSIDDSGLYPFQFSGGQRQRIAIARALAVQPDLLIADEITSSLDVSVQAAIINLLRDIQRASGIALLFVSHNLGVVRYTSVRTAVMHLGVIVENGDTDDVFRAPCHPYTRALIDAIPTLDATCRRGAHLEGEVPDPHQPPTGCRFHPRCPVGPDRVTGRDICRRVEPDGTTHLHGAKCHFPLAGPGAASPGTPFPTGETLTAQG